jgi:two-component system NtrC family sensor kinase
MNHVAPFESSTPARILVVDDEPEIAESLAELLTRKEGYQVAIARDGREAMSMLKLATADPALAFDLVLLDVRMPVMSGPEVLAWLRSHSELQFTRVIVLTAAAGYEEKVEALVAGADDYIIKPYYPLELLARVKTILRPQQLEKQLKRQSQQLVSLNRVSQAVTAKLATAEVLALAAEGVEDIFDVELAAVFMIDDDRSHLHCRNVQPAGPLVTKDTWSPVPVGMGIVGASYEQQNSLCFNEPIPNGRFQPGLDAPTNFPLKSIMVTPLFVRGKPVGVMSAMNKREGKFTDVDRGLFTSLASSVSRAVEITWLFQSIRQRQYELLESRNTLQAVIDGILHPIYTIDESWKLVAVNQTKCQELETSPEEVVGQTCYQVFFGRDKPCKHCLVASILEEKKPQYWTVTWRGPDHRQQEWVVNAYPIPGSKAGSARAVVVWQDRTEERRLESSLMQAGKLAAIGQLAAGVAHEINNPLTAINANAEILQMTIAKDDDNFESVELIALAGDRAAKVVSGLLDFARQTEYDFELADINDSIRQALSLVTYQFRVANIEVIANLADDLPEVDASLEHLQSVWLNLLINARDALQDSDSDRRVEIITRYEPDHVGDIMVIVRDTGQGMSSPELEHIFEPFYTTKSPGKGTGLGLATCHRIIEQHGGEIDVSSAPGEGTTFVVRLPIDNRRNDSSIIG